MFQSLWCGGHQEGDHATLYLVDTSMVWWRRRCGNIEHSMCAIALWEDFKRELKKQFYPEHAKRDARAKLWRLVQKGSIRDYVKEFSEVLWRYPTTQRRMPFLTF